MKARHPGVDGVDVELMVTTFVSGVAIIERYRAERVEGAAGESSVSRAGW